MIDTGKNQKRLETLAFELTKNKRDVPQVTLCSAVKFQRFSVYPPAGNPLKLWP